MQNVGRDVVRTHSEPDKPCEATLKNAFRIQSEK